MSWPACDIERMCLLFTLHIMDDPSITQSEETHAGHLTYGKNTTP